MHPPYTHTQRASAILLGALLFPLLIIVGAFIVIPGLPLPMLLPIAIVIVAAFTFSSLTIQVDSARLQWRFGPGLIRKSVAISDVVSAEHVKTTFWQGWGIHLTRNGWLYNVAGFDAVRVRLRNGKTFLLGTDEPAVLCAAIKVHLEALAHRTLPNR